MDDRPPRSHWFTDVPPPPTIVEVESFAPKRRFACARCDVLGMVSPRGVWRRFRVRMRDPDGEVRDYCIVCASIRTGVSQGVLMRCAGTGPIAGPLPEVAGWCPLGEPARDDDGVFEALAAATFQARFRPDVVRARWPAIRAAFANFSVEAVARWPATEAERLLAVPGMVRNAKRVRAVLANARELATIQGAHGSFSAYAATFGGDTAALVADIDRWAHYVGAPSIRWFLGCAGFPRG